MHSVCRGPVVISLSLIVHTNGVSDVPLGLAQQAPGSSATSCLEARLQDDSLSFLAWADMNHSQFTKHLRRFESPGVAPLFDGMNRKQYMENSRDCTLRGDTYFLLMADIKRYFRRVLRYTRVDGLTSQARNYPGLFVGVCVSASCTAFDMVNGFWPTLLGLIIPPSGVSASDRPLLLPKKKEEVACRQFSVLVSGAVKTIPKEESTLACKPIVPDIFVALAPNPSKRLELVSQQCQERFADRLDWRVTGQRWEPAIQEDRTDVSVNLKVPAGVSHVIVDVGAGLDSHEPKFFHQLENDTSLLVIALEPSPPAYEDLLRWRQRTGTDVATRFWIWPLAAAPEAGMRWLHHSPSQGECSSLLPFNADALIVAGTERCTLEGAGFLVPSLPLAELLAALPQHLELSLLKVDAQGLDLQVALSAGPALRRFRALSLEVQEELAEDPRIRTTMRYVGQPTKGEVVAALAREGFRLLNCQMNSDEIGEQDCDFEHVREE